MPRANLRTFIAYRPPRESSPAPTPRSARSPASRRLAISENRINPLRDQLAAALTYSDRLRRLELRSVDPMARVGEGANRLDDDAPDPTLASSDLMRVTDTMEPFIKVPKVLGGAEGA